MREKLFIFSLFVLTSLCLLCAGIMLLAAFWKYQPQDDAYVIMNPQVHEAKYISGDLVSVTRQFKINKPVILEVERELIQKKDNGILVRVEIPGTIVSYEPGVYTTERMFEIPNNIPAGHYELDNKVCWNQNPLKKSCVTLPRLPISYNPK